MQTAGSSCSKTNDIVETSNVSIGNMPIFFVEKTREVLAVQKFLSFLTKNISVFGNKVVKHLTS